TAPRGRRVRRVAVGAGAQRRPGRAHLGARRPPSGRSGPPKASGAGRVGEPPTSPPAKNRAPLTSPSTPGEACESPGGGRPGAPQGGDRARNEHEPVHKAADRHHFSHG